MVVNLKIVQKTQKGFGAISNMSPNISDYVLCGAAFSSLGLIQRKHRQFPMECQR